MNTRSYVKYLWYKLTKHNWVTSLFLKSNVSVSTYFEENVMNFEHSYCLLRYQSSVVIRAPPPGTHFCVVTLVFGFFCGCRGCHRTESDLFFYTFGICTHTVLCRLLFIWMVWKFVKGKTEVPRNVRNSEVIKQDKFRRDLNIRTHASPKVGHEQMSVKIPPKETANTSKQIKNIRSKSGP